MTSVRPTVRRRVLAGLVPLLLVAGTLPLLADTCSTTAAGTRTFSRNSLIIPMDVCYQSMTDGISTSGYTPYSCPQTKASGDVVKAYGLVYQLIRNGVTVYWVINQGKTAVTDVDMTVQYAGGVPAVLYGWSTGSTTSTAPTSGHAISYRGGPFVVDGADFAKASAILQTYKATFSAVNVHVANVAFQGYVAKTMAGGWSAGGTVAPKLALLDIGSTGSGTKNSEPVIQGYLTRAGLDTTGAAGTAGATTHGAIFDKLVMSDFVPTTAGDWTTTNLYKYGYEILWVPHWISYGSCSDYSSDSRCANSQYSDATVAAALASIGSFNAAKHDVFAECAGLGSFDGVFSGSGTGSYNSYYSSGGANTHFQTSSPYGFWINKWAGGNTQPAAVTGGWTSPFMQIGDFPFVIVSGAIEDYRPSAFVGDVTTYISYAADTTYDVFTLRPATSAHGTVVYLAGHSYSGTDGSFEVAGTRLVLNTLFNLGAACVESGAACNTGLLGVCAAGVMSCNASGAYCKQTTAASAEVCDGLDNDCNGAVDDGLDVECYDGPSATKNVGTCTTGVSSCIQKPDGTYAMSACVGEVLPTTEICNGLDDDCDGRVDNVSGTTTALTGACYTGPDNTMDSSGNPLGICKAGVATCTNGNWGACAVCDESASHPAYLHPTDAAFAKCQILPLTQSCDESTGQSNGEWLDMTCTGVINCGCVNGATQPCYDGTAATKGVGICKAGTRICSNLTWGECSGEQLPLAADCSSSLDNDCNGTPDNQESSCSATCPTAHDEALFCRVPKANRDNVTDTSVGTPKGVCLDGTRTCANGVLSACSGEILPSPEVCDGKDNDCNGLVDDGKNLCGTGFSCINGVCVQSSCAVENPCPKGYECSDKGVCVLSTCGTKTCAAGQDCEFEQCVNPCASVKCGTGDLCSSGACTGGGCYSTGCATGEVCESGTCVTDPCAGVACPTSTFCRGGDCVQSCVFVTCSTGQKCSSYGFCEDDPCASLTCGAGELCDGGSCVPDYCEGLGCGNGQTCLGGVCEDDPCNDVTCPVGACSGGQCYPVSTPSTAKATTSSSGCGCGQGGATPLGALLLLLAVPLARRRAARRGRGGTALLALAAVAALGASGCHKKTSVDTSACAETCGTDQCVDLNFNESHCGRCDTACATGETCVDAVCNDGSVVAPYLDAVSPSQALAGAAAPVTVTLTGKRFEDGATLRLIAAGGTVTYATAYVSATELTASLNLSGTSVSDLELQVVNPGLVVSNTVAFSVVSKVTPVVDDVYYYLDKAAGTKSTAVTAGETVTLHVEGENFSSSSVCHVSSPADGATALTTAANSDGTLDCTFDSREFTPGTITFWVVNNGKLESNKDHTFTVVSATPVLASLSPSTAQAGNYVNLTLTGTGFDLSSVVHFTWSGGGTDQPMSTTYDTATQLTVAQLDLTKVVAPKTASVTVHNGSLTSNALTLSVANSVPQVTNLSVASSTGATAVYQADTAVLTFTGSNFPATASVTIVPPSGASATQQATSVTSTSLTASFPLTGVAGVYSAYVTFPTTGASSTFSFRVLSNVAVLRTVSPASGKQGTTTPVTLTASNLRGGNCSSTATCSTALYLVVFNGSSLTPSSVTITNTASNTGTVVVSLPLAGLATREYTLSLTNPHATTSNQLSFSVAAGPPTVTSISPACVVQQDAAVTVTITGTNFASGDNASEVQDSADGTTFYTTTGTATVNGPTQITVVLDTRTAPVDPTNLYTRYYVRILNPGPLYSNIDKTLTVAAAASNCP